MMNFKKVKKVFFKGTDLLGYMFLDRTSFVFPEHKGEIPTRELVAVYNGDSMIGVFEQTHDLNPIVISAERPEEYSKLYKAWMASTSKYYMANVV